MGEEFEGDGVGSADSDPNGSVGTETGAENAGGAKEDVEALARKMGWTEKEKFRGDQSKFIDASTYILNTHNINSTLKNKVKEITSAVDHLKAFNENVYNAEVKRLQKEVEELKTQRKTAIADGDVERVEEIEKQIDDIHASVPQKPVAQETPTANPIFESWVMDNQWYRDDKELRVWADEQGQEYKGLSYDKILKFVKRDIVAAFPDKFKKKTVPGAGVEGGSRQATSRTKISEANLTEEQRGIMKSFISHGVMSAAEYIAGLEKVGA